jgi:hypothetical protein
MRASIWPGFALFAGLAVAISVGASCSGRPLVGSPNAAWRPVGCPQAGDPPIYIAEADGDVYRLDPNTLGASLLGTVTCPQRGMVNAMGINRRGEILLALGDMRVGRVRIQAGADPLSACENTTFPAGMMAPISRYSGLTFALNNEGDVGGDDAYLWAFDGMQTTTYLARYPVVGTAPVSSPQTRFVGGDRSDGFCRSPMTSVMLPPTCSGPRIAAQLSNYPNRNATNRSIVAVTFVDGAFQIMFIDDPSEGQISEIRPVTGVPIDAYASFQASAVWGDTLYLFIGRSPQPMLPPPTDGGDAGPMMRPDVQPPNMTTVHRIPLSTGVADANVGQLDGIVPTAASVPPCMRYTP